MSQSLTTPARRRPQVLAATAMAGLMVLSACSAPGSSSDEDATAASGDGDDAEVTEETDAFTCGTDDVVIDAYVETGFPLFRELADEFTAQHPNVTFDIREDQFAVITQNAPRILADDPPDIMRLPQMSELASDGLLLDLDEHAAAFGWDQWPASQLEQMRVDEEGRRGSGPLYAMGVNFSMTGVFYNKELAEQIGMDEAPATLDEFDGYMQAALDAGITPSAQFNGGATGGLAFPLQGLMASYGDPAEINSWIYQHGDATIDTPTNLEATEHLKSWIDAGFFADDINSLDYSQTMARFIDGDNLFLFTGDWESGTLDAQMPGNVGFFLVPPVEDGGEVGAMSAPLTYGIGNGAANADCAAFFLDWVATNDDARTIAVEVGGSHPMGPVDAFMPEIDPESVTAQTLAAGATIGEDDGAMDFIANATGAIYARGWTPNLQKLVAGEQDPAGLLADVQASYEAEIG